MKLAAVDLQWITGPEDDPADQCAHGKVLLQVDAAVYVQPEDGKWTLSAAGLFLLRTLEHDHTEANPVSDHSVLIPCCGDSAWLIEGGRFKLVCMGCGIGKNPAVIHRGKTILIRGEQEQTVSFMEWKDSVFAFVDQVQEFYDKVLS